MRILEDFIHLIGEAQKPFQSFLVVTNNLSESKSLALINQCLVTCTFVSLVFGVLIFSFTSSLVLELSLQALTAFRYLYLLSGNHPERARISGFQ